MPAALVGCFVLLAAWLVVPQAGTAPPPQAEATLDREERARFLRTARIVDAEPISRGVTQPYRLTLRDGTLTHDAAFQSVHERSGSVDLRDGVRRAGEAHFVDYWGYNVAAYEIAVLLGLGDMMPVTVRRSWNGRDGALSWWVDDVLMDEAERQEGGVRPPDIVRFEQQLLAMYIFAALVDDTDRNKGNVLFTVDWSLVMLDFTRAFRLTETLREPERLQRCSHELFDRLKGLTEARVSAVTRDYLTIYEIRPLLMRRDLIVQHFERLIAERGEKSVLYKAGPGQRR